MKTSMINPEVEESTAVSHTDRIKKNVIHKRLLTTPKTMKRSSKPNSARIHARVNSHAKSKTTETASNSACVAMSWYPLLRSLSGGVDAPGLAIVAGLVLSY